MRIAVLAPFDLGLNVGAAIVLRSLLAQWRDRHDVTLVTNRAGGFRMEGLQTSVVGGSTYRDWLARSPVILGGLSRVDVVLDQSYLFPVLAASRLGSPVAILHSHGVPSVGGRRWPVGDAGIINYATRLISTRIARATVVASEVHRKAMVLSYGVSVAGKLRPIWHGVDLAAFPETGPRGNNVLFVANLTGGDAPIRKGVSTLLTALKRLSRENPGVRLVVVGEFDARLPKMVESWGLGEIVRVVGPVNHTEMSKAFADCRLLVLPSLFDTYGSVVNEAMASGVPVVVSDQAGVCEVVLQAHSGLVFRAGDSAGLYRCLGDLLTDDSLAQSVGENGRRFARQNLGWDIIGQKYIRLFESKGKSE